MTAVAFHRRNDRQHAFAGECRGVQFVTQRRTPIRQRPGLVEDHGPTKRELFERGRVFHDDASTGGGGNRTDNRHRNGDQERTRSRNHDDAEKPDGVPRRIPGEGRDRNGNRCIPGAELIADSAKIRSPLFGVPHDVHDLRVPGICRDSSRPDHQRCVAVDRSGQDRGARSL